MKNLPDKIYILQHEDYSDRRILNAFTEKESNTDVEYTRKDAFIEKACEWIKSHGGFTLGFDGATVRDFLNFINK